MTATRPDIDDLICWLSLEERSGTREDSHAANHFSIGGGSPGAAAGKQGNSISLAHATGDRLNLAAPHDLNTLGDFTITFWVKHSGNWYDKPVYDNIICTGTGQNTGGWQIRGAHTAGRAYTAVACAIHSGDGNGSLNIHITEQFPDTWYFCVFSHTAATKAIACYSDNILEESNNYTFTFQDYSDNEAAIGAFSGGAQGFDGLVDEINMWSKVLSAGEMDWLKNGSDGRSYSDMSDPATVSSRLSLMGAIAL